MGVRLAGARTSLHRGCHVLIGRRLVEAGIVGHRGHRGPLADAEPDGFQIGPFERLEPHRVVGRGSRHAQDLHRSAGLAGGGSEQDHEFFDRQEARAGAGQEDPAGLDAVEGQDVEVEILALAGGDVESARDQLGRVEHDDAEGLAIDRHLSQITKRVGVDEARTDLIGIGVLLREGDRFLIEIHARDLGSPALDHGIESETAGVTTGVEHGPAGREPGEGQPVIALIAEKAGLVTALELDAEADAVLVDRHPRGEFARGHRAAREVLRECDPVVDVDPEVLRPDPFGQPIQDRADPLVYPQAEDLGREDVVKSVDDQATEAIGFGVDESVSVGRFVELEEVAAERDRLFDPAFPERGAGSLDARLEKA